MAGFVPLTEPEQLPAEGTSLETLARDFKRLAPDLNPPEMAKDVAAFANRIGGVLVVGAIENRVLAVLDRYEPRDAEAAAAVLKAYSQAVRDFCSPQPIFETVRLSKGDGFVVAVNVWPFPGQAVGVRRGRGDEAPYIFPMRTGTDCVYLRPEQLPMLMIPELRRVIALLYSIPHGARVSWNYNGGRAEHMNYDFDGVNETTNVAKFRNPGNGGPFTIPIDFIRSVWCDENDRWHITGIASLSAAAQQ